jgi:hypothetical protein
MSRGDDQLIPVSVDTSWALRPHCPDGVQPLLKPLPQSARPGVVCSAYLSDYSIGTEDGNRLLAFRNKTPVGQPHEQVQQSGRRREHLYRFKICRYRMACHLRVKLVTEDNQVVGSAQESDKVRDWRWVGSCGGSSSSSGCSRGPGQRVRESGIGARTRFPAGSGRADRPSEAKKQLVPKDLHPHLAFQGSPS